MAQTVTARTPEELRALAARIHDQTFSVDAIAHDRDRRQLVIPFFIEDVTRETVRSSTWRSRTWLGRTKSVDIPLRRAELRFTRVVDFDVNDRSHIDFVTAVDLRMEDPATATLEAAEDVAVRVRVEELDVTLAVTDDVVGSRRGRYGWWGDARSHITLVTPPRG